MYKKGIKLTHVPTAREIILPLSMMFTRSDKARITLLELLWPLLSNSINHYHRCNGKQHTQRYHILLIISGEKLSCFLWITLQPQKVFGDIFTSEYYESL